MTDRVTRLTDRRVVAVGGAECRPFLQRLITNDVESLALGEARFAALLTPQGKILVDFFAVATADGFLLDVPAAAAAELVRRLTLYRLRAAVSVAEEPSLAVVAFTGRAPAGLVLSYADPRATALWQRAFVPQAAQPAPDAAVRAAYEAARIRAGVPDGSRDYAFGDTFPHEANLDRLHGVDFRKGCYVGQEVVSRMEHRGTARKRVALFSFEGAPPSPGAEILAGDGPPLGTFGTAEAGYGLGLIRLDRLHDATADGMAVSAGGVPLQPVPAD